MKIYISLDDDVEMTLREEMYRRNCSFDEAVNRVLRIGLKVSVGIEAPFEQQTYPMGFCESFNIDKALSLAGNLEDEVIIQKMKKAK